jgi:hypothetical protein
VKEQAIAIARGAADPGQALNLLREMKRTLTKTMKPTLTLLTALLLAPLAALYAADAPP